MRTPHWVSRRCDHPARSVRADLLRNFVAGGVRTHHRNALAGFSYRLLNGGGVAFIHSLSSLDDSDPLQRPLGAALATAMLLLVFMQFLESYWVDSGTPQVLWTLAALIPAGAFGWARVPARP